MFAEYLYRMLAIQEPAGNLIGEGFRSGGLVGVERTDAGCFVGYLQQPLILVDGQHREGGFAILIPDDLRGVSHRCPISGQFR